MCIKTKKSSNNSKELASPSATKLASSHPSMSPSRSEPSQLASQLASQPVSQPASQPANQTLSNRLAPGSQQATAIHPGNQIASASLMFFYGKRRFFFFFYLSRRRDLTRKPTCSNIFLQQIHFRFRVNVYKKNQATIAKS